MPKSFHTTKKFYKKLCKNKRIKSIINDLSLPKLGLTKYATAELLHKGKFVTNADEATLLAFHTHLDDIPSTVLQNRIKLIFDIAQAQFIALLHELMLSNPEGHTSALKLIAEIRNLLGNDERDPAKLAETGLTINLTTEKPLHDNYTSSDSETTSIQ